MLRGRIVKLNGVPVADAHIAADSRWAVNSDRAVTYASMPPKEAKVVEGPPGGPPITAGRRWFRSIAISPAAWG